MEDKEENEMADSHRKENEEDEGQQVFKREEWKERGWEEEGAADLQKVEEEGVADS